MNDSKDYYAIFPADTFDFFAQFDKDKIKKHTPTEEEAEMALFVLADYIQNHPDIPMNRGPITKVSLEKYKIQLSGYVNDQNELIIEMNGMIEAAALKDVNDWRKEIFLGYEDGGNSFFRSKVNLDQMNVIELWPNGRA